MQTYLQIHGENTAGPQARYRAIYKLKYAEYEFHRVIGRKGEIISDIKGGIIQVGLRGFADSFLIQWIFDSFKKENGVIVTMDEQERVIEKFQFMEARAYGFRMNYDNRLKESIVTMVTLEARQIATDNEIYFQLK